MPNTYRGEREITGVGTLRYDWDAVARLVDAFGPDFDAKLGAAFIHTDMSVIARAVAIGTGKTEDEIKAACPPIMPTINAIHAALNLAFHGQGKAPPVTPGESNPTGWILWIWRVARRLRLA